jgi:hypothetical protein
VTHAHPDAFEYYVRLGTARSYSAVASAFGVRRHDVAEQAKREHWAARLARIERRALDRAGRHDALTAWHDARRRRDAAKADLVKGFQIGSASDAIDLLALATQLERAALACDFDQAELLIDLLALRMWRMGQLDRTALAVFGPLGGPQ